MITELDGESVSSPDDLVAAIAEHQPGDEVGVTASAATTPTS